MQGDPSDATSRRAYGFHHVSVVVRVALCLLASGCPRPMRGISPAGRSDLANEVVNAHNAQAMFEGLLDVARHLNIGVYRPDGKVLNRGAERSWKDLYLYDFELQIIASRMLAGDRWRLADITVVLNSMSPQARPLDDGSTGKILRNAVRTALSIPRDKRSQALLLVHDLGLAQSPPLDLSSAPDNAIQLDALQYWLVLADAILPFVVSGESALVPSPLPGFRYADFIQTPSVRPQLRLADVLEGCGEVGEVVGGVWELGIFAIGWIEHGVHVVEGAIFGLHGSILALSVRVGAKDEKLETHYGPKEGHPNLPQAGDTLEFRTQVTMLDDLSTVAVKCGWLTGVEFPPKGPIENVKVVWDAPSSGLRQHGELNCEGSFACTTMTDRNGIAHLKFQPKDEQTPGKGMTKVDNGIVSAIARYQTRFRNVLGGFNEIATPKYVSTAWFVGYHDQLSAQSTFQYTGRWGLSGGDDEFCRQHTSPGTDTFTGEFHGDENRLDGDFKRTTSMPYCNGKGGPGSANGPEECVLMVTGTQTVHVTVTPEDEPMSGHNSVRVAHVISHAVNEPQFSFSGDCFGDPSLPDGTAGWTRAQLEDEFKGLSHNLGGDFLLPPGSRLRPGKYETRQESGTLSFELNSFAIDSR